MLEPTAAPCAATILFNLPGYRVIDVSVGGEYRRRVLVETVDVAAGCPGCGVVSGRVHQRTLQRLKDVAFDGLIEVVWRKKRWRCAEDLCLRSTFTEHTEQVPARARLTARLVSAVLDAVTSEARAVDRVAVAHGLSWPTVQRLLSAASTALLAKHPRLTRHLGIDEHRFRSVRFFRDESTGSWKRIEPWSTTFTCLDTSRVLGVVDGRDGAAVRRWLKTQPRWWRHRVQVVAIDPSAAFRSAVRPLLPNASVVVDRFHLVKLANDMLTAVRRRLSWEWHERRGRKSDSSWAHRLLLLRAGNTLSSKGISRLLRVFAEDDPTGELGAAWGVKEQLRNLLACRTLVDARAARVAFNEFIVVADMTETDRLKKTIDAWWREIEVFITSRVTNARSEAVNLNSKQIKRAGRGFRNHENYRSRILLTSAARSAA